MEGGERFAFGGEVKGVRGMCGGIDAAGFDWPGGEYVVYLTELHRCWDGAATLRC